MQFRLRMISVDWDIHGLRPCLPLCTLGPKGLLPLDGKVAHQHSHPLNVSFPLLFFNFTTQQIDISFLSEQEFSELFGLVPHSAHEESYSNHHTDVDNDKVI